MLKLSKQELMSLISELRRLGFEVITPTRSNETVRLTSLSSPSDLETAEGAYSGSKGKGVFIAEAPRGMLCHSCEVEDGLIKGYKVCTPTAVNSMSIERDAVELVKRFGPIGMEKLRFILEDLVRSYDPCLSCAVSLDVYG